MHVWRTFPTEKLPDRNLDRRSVDVRRQQRRDVNFLRRSNRRRHIAPFSTLPLTTSHLKTFSSSTLPRLSHSKSWSRHICHFFSLEDVLGKSEFILFGNFRSRLNVSNSKILVIGKWLWLSW